MTMKKLLTIPIAFCIYFLGSVFVYEPIETASAQIPTPNKIAFFRVEKLSDNKLLISVEEIDGMAIVQLMAENWKQTQP